MKTRFNINFITSTNDEWVCQYYLLFIPFLKIIEPKKNHKKGKILSICLVCEKPKGITNERWSMKEVRKKNREMVRKNIIDPDWNISQTKISFKSLFSLLYWNLSFPLSFMKYTKRKKIDINVTTCPHCDRRVELVNDI